MNGGLIPKPYRKDGETDVYRIPVHFWDGETDAYRIPVHFFQSGRVGRELCPWGGKDAIQGELDHCPQHGEVTSLCEVNPDHLMARVPAVAFVSTAMDSATPACRNCATGTVVSAELLS